MPLRSFVEAAAAAAAVANVMESRVISRIVDFYKKD